MTLLTEIKYQELHIRGKRIYRIPFSEIEDYLVEKGLNSTEIFNLMADENEYVYVSNGFYRGLLNNENDEGEWHHYFRKDEDGDFVAGKLQFK